MRITSHQPQQLVARQMQKVKMLRCGVGTIPSSALTSRDVPRPRHTCPGAERIRSIPAHCHLGDQYKPTSRFPALDGRSAPPRAGAPPSRCQRADEVGVTGKPGARAAADTSGSRRPCFWVDQDNPTARSPALDGRVLNSPRQFHLDVCADVVGVTGKPGARTAADTSGSAVPAFWVDQTTPRIGHAPAFDCRVLHRGLAHLPAPPAPG